MARSLFIRRIVYLYIHTYICIYIYTREARGWMKEKWAERGKKGDRSCNILGSHCTCPISWQPSSLSATAWQNIRSFPLENVPSSFLSNPNFHLFLLSSPSTRASFRRAFLSCSKIKVYKVPPARVYASVRVYEKRIQAHTYMENARKTRYIYIYVFENGKTRLGWQGMIVEGRRRGCRELGGSGLRRMCERASWEGNEKRRRPRAEITFVFLIWGT